MREDQRSGREELDFVFRFAGRADRVSIRIVYSAVDDTAVVLVRRSA